MQNIRPLLFILWTASLTLVAIGSLTPGTNTPPPFPMADKLLHMAAYAWLAALALKVFLARQVAFTCAWGMILFGAALEVAQSFVPLRSPSLGDIAVNILGVCIGVLIGQRLKAREHDRKMDEILRR